MEGEGDSQQNLNDLQNYLVHFNKEIEVTGDSAFQHNVSQILTQSVQPVFVSVPVSSETSTPDEEQLPVISEIKGSDGCKVGQDVLMDDALHPSPVGQSLTDNVPILEMSPDGQKDEQLVSVDSSLEGLSQGTMRLQEISPEQVIAQGHLGFTVSEGMLVLPMGDAGSVLSQSDPHLVQLVNINGQPTLHIVSDPSGTLNRQQTSTPGVQINPVVNTPGMRLVASSASQTGVIDTSDPVSVLASVAANTNNVNQLPILQATQQDVNGAQLVALRNSADGSQPQLVAVQVDENNQASTTTNVSSVDGLQLSSPVALNPGTGYQSVAIMASGEGGQQGEVNYVLIVNQNTDSKDTLQAPVFDYGDDFRGEVIQELTDENGAVKRLVKINQILGKRSADNVHAIPVGDQLMCSYCNYTSHKRYLLSRHMKSHSEERPHKCGLCQRGFKTLASLQNHINTHTGTRPHKCKLCESAFTTSGELVRHIRYKHTFEKPHKCTECDYASVELSKLKRHIRSHTGERPYACGHCNYASPDTYKLKRHMRIHTGEKPYECDVCHAKFTQSNSLKAHKLIHTGNKPVFQCSLCPATCGRKTDLKIHMLKLHTSDHPLQCKKCGQNFKDRYTFKMHAKSHEGEKCYKCSECQYAATCHRHLMTHMLTHSNSKPFECEDCDLAFRQKQLLKRHRNLYHNTENSPQDPQEKEGEEEECKACVKAFITKDRPEQHRPTEAGASNDKDGDDDTEKEEDFHTCGGTPKTTLEGLVPLTADQLIENSLLADMKEGKLGISPKVVVVHPDGRVEEVTAKLQSLSQSKPMDDFLVSLGVTGDAQFDQDTELTADDLGVTTTNGPGIVTVTPAGDNNSRNTVEKIIMKHEPVEYVLDNELGIDQTKEESTQASFDSDDEESKKLRILGQEQLLRLAQGVVDESIDGDDFVEFKVTNVTNIDKPLEGSIQQMIVNVFQSEENRCEKRRLEDENLPQDKRIKLVQDVTDITS